MLYMLAPEKVTGWPNRPTPEERLFIAQEYRHLPALGRLTGRGGTTNLETVLKAKPDLILDFGSVRGTYVSLADAVQEQTKIPAELGLQGRAWLRPKGARPNQASVLADPRRREEAEANFLHAIGSAHVPRG